MPGLPLLSHFFLSVFIIKQISNSSSVFWRVNFVQKRKGVVETRHSDHSVLGALRSVGSEAYSTVHVSV